MFSISIAAVSLIAWIYILIGRGRFWQVGLRILPRMSCGDPVRIVAVIPARNEADVIGHSVSSLLLQNATPALHIIVVDDASSDDTAAAAVLAAYATGYQTRLTVIHGKPLPAGWTGKLWALSQGVERALQFEPDYLLLTDADIAHGKDGVASLVTVAQTNQCDLASLMVKLACHSVPEQALIPAFVFFFLQLYPPAWTESNSARTAGAAGGCVLVRPSALQRIGGLAAIRNQVIDDCALARAIKDSGGQIWMGLAPETSSIRTYRTWGEIEKMIARSAFSQLNHSVWFLFATVIGMLAVYVTPLLVLFTRSRPAFVLGALAWSLMSIAYWPTVKFYGQTWLLAISLPVVATFYLFATIHSAWLYLTGHGGAWKGRVQDKRG